MLSVGYSGIPFNVFNCVIGGHFFNQFWADKLKSVQQNFSTFFFCFGKTQSARIRVINEWRTNSERHLLLSIRIVCVRVRERNDCDAYSESGQTKVIDKKLQSARISNKSFDNKFRSIRSHRQRRPRPRRRRRQTIIKIVTSKEKRGVRERENEHKTETVTVGERIPTTTTNEWIVVAVVCWICFRFIHRVHVPV